VRGQREREIETDDGTGGESRPSKQEIRLKSRFFPRHRRGTSIRSDRRTDLPRSGSRADAQRRKGRRAIRVFQPWTPQAIRSKLVRNIDRSRSSEDRWTEPNLRAIYGLFGQSTTYKSDSKRTTFLRRSDPRTVTASGQRLLSMTSRCYRNSGITIRTSTRSLMTRRDKGGS